MRKKRELDLVFILEDEELNMLIVTDTFYQIGIDPIIVEANNTNEGIKKYLELLEEKKPDFALIDIKLDDSPFDGIEFIRKVNEEYGNGTLIGVLSYSSDERDIKRAIKVGANFYAEKGGGSLFMERMKILVKHFFEDDNESFLLLLNE